MSNQYLSFDVTKQSAPQQLITGRQGDSQLKFVTMLFWDGDKNIPYDLTGKQVAFEALKPDNTHIVDYEGVTVLDAPAGLVRYSFNEQVFAAAGTMQQAFFKITHTDSDNNVIADSTLEVAINILENRVEFGINSKDYLSAYDDLIAQVKKKFDDYAATVQDSIDKAQSLHQEILNYIKLIQSERVLLFNQSSQSINGINVGEVQTQKEDGSNIQVYPKTHADAVDGFDEKVSNLLDNDVDITTISKFDNASNTLYWVTTIPNSDKFGNKITLKHGFGNDKYNDQQMSAGQFNKLHDNAVFISNGSPTPRGNVIQNGTILNNESIPGKETLAVKGNGLLESYPSGTDAETVLKDNVFQAWSGFFTLVKGGKIYDYATVAKQNTSADDSFEYLSKPNPRKIIGQKESGEYVVITSDGRKTNSVGFTLDDAARISIEEGLDFAFNLDGGGSTNTIVKGHRVGGLFDSNGTVERNNVDFIYIDIENRTQKFDMDEYQAETNGITAYLTTKYNLTNTLNALVNQTIKPTYIPITDTFTTYDRKLQYRVANGQVSIFGRLLINPKIADTSVIHGKDYPIATNVDFGLNNNSDVIFEGFTVGDGGTGGIVKIAYDVKTKNLYIYEPDDKIKKLVLTFYVTIPQFV